LLPDYLEGDEMNALRSRVGLGLLAAILLGCGQPPADKPAPPKPAASHDEHDHGAGPHGGTIGEWGGGAYHIEFTVDHDKHQAVIYILGEDVKTPAPVKTDKLLLALKAPMVQIELAAEPLEGEAPGTSSRFVGHHDSLGKEQKFAGSVTAEIEGTPYSGDFQEKPE
jgi:hypothetical protein